MRHNKARDEEICLRRAKGETVRSLSQEYGIGPKRIREIVGLSKPPVGPPGFASVVTSAKAILAKAIAEGRADIEAGAAERRARGKL